MALTIFDLDNTLIDCDSDYEWGQFLVNKKLVNKDEYEAANRVFYEQYNDGSLDIHKYCSFSFKPLTQYSMEELATLHKEFMESVILPKIKPKSHALIETHRQRDDTLMIITATNSFITRPIANYFGIPHLIGVDPKIVDGRYTTEVDGIPSFKEGKVSRLNHWLEENNTALNGSTFYSDSHNDVSLLEKVDYPIAVDPDEQLEAIAKERQWEIISLKNDKN